MEKIKIGYYQDDIRFYRVRKKYKNENGYFLFNDKIVEHINLYQKVPELQMTCLSNVKGKRITKQEWNKAAQKVIKYLNKYK